MISPSAFVIEDDDEIGEIYSQALRMAHYEPIHIQNGLEALEKLRTMTPDLIVLDLHIPKLGGATVLRAIRSDTRMQGACVIVVTADANAADALRRDADEVLVKPVGFTKIRELAEKRLRSRGPIL